VASGEWHLIAQPPSATSWLEFGSTWQDFALVSTCRHLAVTICQQLQHLAALGSTWQHLAALGSHHLSALAALASLGSTWLHLAALGCTWLHLAALGCTWLHVTPLGSARVPIAVNLSFNPQLPHPCTRAQRPKLPMARPICHGRPTSACHPAR
jgi:hypothetical protein